MPAISVTPGLEFTLGCPCASLVVSLRLCQRIRYQLGSHITHVVGQADHLQVLVLVAIKVMG